MTAASPETPATDGSEQEGPPMPPRNRTNPETPPTATAATAEPELEVEHITPMFWMKSTATDAFFPAYDLGGRYELEGAGCTVSDETPAEMPAATGTGPQA